MDKAGNKWKLMLGDCIERAAEVEDESVGLSVFSPPFPGMYVYSDSPRDMGNARSLEELVEHYAFLIPELLRMLMPGRSVCVHLCQMVTVKYLDGYSGLRDFRGAVIDAMEDGGFRYYGEVAIDKDPQVKAIRTKDQGLLFKTLANDSSRMHMALADYLLQFRKPGDNPEPVRAGVSERYGNPDGWITSEEWIEWAAPVWYRAGEGYPGGIRETDVLNVAVARENSDERHIAPLQLGVIERAVKLWSNPGDLVFSPFAGIGSEGHVALKHGRRFVGVELKPSYFETAARNLEAAEGQMSLLAEGQRMIALFSEILAHFPASRAKAFDERFGIECVYALVWPDYELPVTNHPKANREAFSTWRTESGVPLWAWINCKADQAADAQAIATLDADLSPDGWLLDIEGEWVKGANLETLIAAATATGKPVRASLAGVTSSHIDYDFRTLERYGVAVDWQAYFDSGEGPTPAVAVSELYAASFVIPGWTYRARLGSTYGWGRVGRVEQGQRAVYDSFRRPGVVDGTFAVGPREWGYTVAGRTLVRDGKDVGLLMGRAPYANIRVTLDVSRTAQSRTPEEWVSIAASARVPGARKRGASVYLAEIASDDVLAAIALGASP